MKREAAAAGAGAGCLFLPRRLGAAETLGPPGAGASLKRVCEDLSDLWKGKLG